MTNKIYFYDREIKFISKQPKNINIKNNNK